mmetsp:Transcript_155871/g.499738  ORF Transcript_155871/g.499738 Transcript_155871/m.499738 type:complete len:229 (+) Transcript_155871:1036-1722(+)
METLRPVSGSSMAAVVSSISACKASSWPVFVEMSPFVFSRSESHHAFCLSSATSSSSIREIILPISSKTIANGLLAFNMATTRPKSELPLVPLRFCKKATALALAVTSGACAAAAPARCRCTAESWMNWAPAAPVDVAATLPKASKALSLLRMAMHSAMAVCSLALKLTRSSYCVFLSDHMSTNFTTKSSASASEACESASCVFLSPKMPSLLLSKPCFNCVDLPISL